MIEEREMSETEKETRESESRGVGETVKGGRGEVESEKRDKEDRERAE